MLVPIGKLMLDAGLGVGPLIQAAKYAYVRAAISQAFPIGTRITASQLSVITGLTRKEIASIIIGSKNRKSPPPKDAKEQRVLRVLRGWTVNPRFADGKGHAGALTLRGPTRSFALLVKIYGGDVTPNAVLKELERMKAIRKCSSGEVKLIARRVRPDSRQHILELSRAFADFVSTVGEEQLAQSQRNFFGFKESTVCSSKTAARFQRTFSNRASALLESVEQWFASQALKAQTPPANKGVNRVGIGVYLVNEAGRQPFQASSVRRPVGFQQEYR